MADQVINHVVVCKEKRFNGGVAQVVEQVTENHRVEDANASSATMKRCLAGRSSALSQIRLCGTDSIVMRL